MYPRKPSCFVAVVAALFASSVSLGCGGGSSSGGQQTMPGVAITVTPAFSISVVNQPTQFTATVTNTTNTAVTWAVEEENGGAVADGLYKAPWTTGIYHVIAASQADPTKSAKAIAAVSAPFAFIRGVTNSDAIPYSMNFMVGNFTASGKFITREITDPTTGKYFEAAISAIVLSGDGSKAVFETTNELHRFSGMYTVRSDGTGLKLILGRKTLIYPELTDPQFTPDGQHIVYTDFNNLLMINTDGSDEHIACYSPQGSFTHVAVSPDESKFAAAVNSYTSPINGIVIMNADCSNMVQLTNVNESGCYDEAPNFSNDGSQIVFSRVCRRYADSYVSASIYAMNVDGTNVRVLSGDGTNGTIHTGPLAVADRIVFASNMNNPNSVSFDLYSIKLDGSSLTRLTANSLYNAFNDEWFAYFKQL